MLGGGGGWYLANGAGATPKPQEETLTTPTEAMDTPPEDLPAPQASPRPGLLMGLVLLARPRQWVKNLLVFVAPGAAGVLSHPSAFWHALGAFGIFCLAASGTYCLNDAIDAESDRRHPSKRYRPVASGVVAVPLALSVGVALLIVSTLLAGWLAGWHLALVMAIYAMVNLAYSLGIKNEPILDLGAISAGFILRAIAGGVATGVALSDWFLIVASFGSLLIVTGKRSGEQRLLAEHEADQRSIRPTLGSYTPTFLRSIRTMSAAVTLTAYCLWAFERAVQIHPGHHPIWFQLTIIPVTLGLLHIVRIFDSGEGADPEALALRDHRLQVYGLVWVVLFAIGVYAS
jgi:decaprenyl-phosphate phosphoribosyltransferase